MITVILISVLITALIAFSIGYVFFKARSAHFEEMLEEQVKAAEADWSPIFYEPSDDIYEALRIEDKRSRYTKEIALQLFKQYIRDDMEFSEVLEMTTKYPKCTRAEQLVMFEELMAIFRLATTPFQHTHEAKVALHALLLSISPEHPMTRVLGRDISKVKPVNAADDIDHTITRIKSLIEGVLNGREEEESKRPKKKTPGDLQEPEEQLHAKDPDSMISDI